MSSTVRISLDDNDNGQRWWHRCLIGLHLLLGNGLSLLFKFCPTWQWHSNIRSEGIPTTVKTVHLSNCWNLEMNDNDWNVRLCFSAAVCVFIGRKEANIFSIWWNFGAGNVYSLSRPVIVSRVGQSLSHTLQSWHLRIVCLVTTSMPYSIYVLLTDTTWGDIHFHQL